MNQELANYTFVGKYAKYLKDLKRRESFDETCDRSESMHLQKYAGSNIDPTIKTAIDYIRAKKILGSQRAFQFAGDPIFKHNARMYNCAGSYCDRLRFFQEAFYLLLCGTGTGFSVQKHHIAKIPDLQSNPFYKGVKTYTIEDSIEGWANSVGVLLSTYFTKSEFPEFEGYEVTFDYSQIRPEGSEFSHGIGVAPGPNGLRNSLEKIRVLLDKALASGRDRIKPIEAYDIVCHIADAVLSGGVRRSSTICLFSYDDEEMLYAKTGNWFITNPQRGRSNNSALLLRNKVTKEEWFKLLDPVKQYGEPGGIWVDNLEFIFNPCCEILFYCYNSKGQSGWQMCNLSTINGAAVETLEDFLNAAEYAAIIGTLQAGYDKFDYLGSVSEEIIRREALIGVSITAMMANPQILLNPEYQQQAAEVVKKSNRSIAEIIGINPAARTTCVKPEGTSSSMLGLLSLSGIHMSKGRRLIRHVQGNKLEKPLQFFAYHNPQSIEKSVWSASGEDLVLAFCCNTPDGAVLERDRSALDFLKMIQSTQKNWVRVGVNNDICVQPNMEHNVSNTVMVKNHEWEDVWNYIYENRYDFAGNSFIADSGDKDYEQAPFVNVLTPEEIVLEYGPPSLFAYDLVSKALETFGSLWSACNLAMGSLSDLPQNQSEWVKSFKSFADVHLSGDYKKMSYLLKDIYYLQKWERILKNYKTVDYTQMVEVANNTQGTNEVACGGGRCDI